MTENAWICEALRSGLRSLRIGAKLMTKTFVGVRLKRLREERGLTQLALAQALGLSASYLNQLEKNQRPLTVPVLLKINEIFGVDAALLRGRGRAPRGRPARSLHGSAHERACEPCRTEGSGLRHAGSGSRGCHAQLLDACGMRWSGRMPWRENSASAQGEFVTLAAPMSYEQVRDFYAHHNYFADLDEAAERLAETARLIPGDMASRLALHLENRYGVRVVHTEDEGRAQMPCAAFCLLNGCSACPGASMTASGRSRSPRSWPSWSTGA